MSPARANRRSNEYGSGGKARLAARNKTIFLAAGCCAVLIFLAGICVGRYTVPVSDVLRCFGNRFFGCGFDVPKEYMSIVIDIRLPRAAVGMLIGAALAASGSAFQGMFRNPLVSQGILGVSSGAGFGAALSILLFTSTFFTPIFAFVFGVIAVVLSFLVARMCNGVSTLMLVLGGTIIAGIFSALLSLLKYLADPSGELASIVFWNMGSLASLQMSAIHFSLGAAVLGMILLLLCGWMVNVLSMGEQEAKSMGLPITTAKILIICGATLATAGSVSIAGNIGWIGLIIPHMARFLIGSDNRKLIPLSMLFGGAFLMLVDLLCRTLTGTEIPIGVMTSLIGGPFFIYLLRRYKGGHWK